MGTYVPNTKLEQQQMLQEIGLASFDDLFAGLPQDMIAGELDLPEGMSELEVARKTAKIAAKNKVFPSCFRGAGAYRHFIPSIVTSVVTKEEFLTAYTPYQAEMSQGILQSIFEYQTMICELTGMDVSNASVYDGAVAAAEAVLMCRDRRHEVVFLAETINPNVMKVVQTYCAAANVKVVIVPAKGRQVDLDQLKDLMDAEEKPAAFYMQQPNFYGIIEQPEAMADIVHEAGAKFVMGCNPISLGMLKTPADCGADVAVGDGQPLGMPLSWGGPYLGFMAAKKDMMRKLPGRIVGETKDADGDRAYVLTLQAREQHIRRDKASSNICSNEALCALTAAVYMSAMGPDGIAEVAKQSASKAHYMADQLAAAGMAVDTSAPFFHEFTAAIPEGSSVTCEDILSALEAEGILGGLPVGEKELLWCTTEVNSKEEIDEAAAIVKAVLDGGKEA